MKLRIRKYGESVLRQSSVPVERFDEELRTLAEDMLETMAAEHGIGLAAQQVGRLEAICVVGLPPEELADAAPDGEPPAMPLVVVNPRVLAQEGPVERCEEGCLSFPGIYAPVARPARLRLRYQDLEGQWREIQAAGLLARCLQHELDHLGGILLPDRIPAIQKVTMAARFRALKKETELALDVAG